LPHIVSRTRFVYASSVSRILNPSTGLEFDNASPGEGKRRGLTQTNHPVQGRGHEEPEQATVNAVTT
jgi:hypothetical protein